MFSKTRAKTRVGPTIQNLFGSVADLEAADQLAGECENQGCEDDGAKNRSDCAYWFADYGEKREQTICGDGDWAKLLQVVRHAEALHERRQNWAERFPSQDKRCGNDWVFNEQAEHQEDGAVADAGQRRDTQIGQELSHSGT